ncbi:CpsD/CapB family tyrosine-protein kinase [Desulfovibrio sp. TomC]|uniref:CpsD/CapB family tyrosine-protein kinase n=1 Tax=Desulfovibrio sp. TomC TaxID=1562888 RepID=UPI000573DC20|nr:CpsD/CapB family tyrosine-protein kinase [Desulfovibrio sp. TomC]KHK00612.1 Tyrosine-protein kinase EpsD [Desulfovibrio sp. TomC]
MSHTACRKAFQRVSVLLAALLAAPLAPALAQESLALVHSVEIVCHHDQGRAMAAMQEGLAVLPRELSGLMQLVSLEGLWCLRLGDTVDEASLRPVLAAVQGHYPQAAMVLGQVGRGKVVARVTSRPPTGGPAPAGPSVAPTSAPTAAAAPGAIPVAAAPSTALAGEIRAASSLAAARPLPPVVLASHTEPVSAPVLPAQLRSDGIPAKAPTGMEAVAGRGDGIRAQASAEPAATATAGADVCSLWAALAAAATATTILVSAVWLWLRRRSRSQSAAARPRLLLRRRESRFATPGLAADDEQRLQGSLPELALAQANLLDANRDRPVKSVYVTSCHNGEGKTTCAIGLAHGLSRTGAKVLLIDGNPQAAALAGCYHTEPSPGLCECLQGAAPADLPRATTYSNLFLLPFGAQSNGGRPDLLAGNRLAEVLAGYGEQFDYVIMDGHSVDDADTNVVASLFDGVLIAVQSGRTNWEVLKRASQKMTLMGATMLGLVLNRRRCYSPKLLCQPL